MRNKNISAAGIFAMKLGFTAFGLLAIWILAGIPEHLDQWWLYFLASAGSASIGLLLLGTAVEAQSDPDNSATRIGGER